MKKVIVASYISLFIALFCGAYIFLPPLGFIAVFLVLLFMVINFAWGLLPQTAKDGFQDDKKRFIRSVFPGMLFLSFGGAAINNYLLPEKFGPINLLDNAGILLFAVFLSWILIRRRKRKAYSIYAGTLILFIAWLAVIRMSGRYVFSSPLDRLRTLQYISAVQPGEYKGDTGVISAKSDLFCSGLNLYCDYRHSAFLMDMTGKIVRSWSGREGETWALAEMLDDGGLLVIEEEGSFPLMKIDSHSNVVWRRGIYAHHDIAIADNKDIYVLTGKKKVAFYHGIPAFLIDNYITILTPDGRIKRNISLYNTLREIMPHDWLRRSHSLLWQRLRTGFSGISTAIAMVKGISLKLTGIDEGYSWFLAYDIVHSNALEIIDRDINGLCKKGGILICSRELNAVGVIDIKRERLIWSWGQGELDGPHDPTILDNGNILVFDNGLVRGYSRVIEIDPISREIVWEYKADPPEKFFSVDRGACQRLPNGNTLITDTDNGHVFEITRTGEVAWEFRNPLKSGKRDIYRMSRIAQ